jgi:hypothetical protein
MVKATLGIVLVIGVITLLRISTIDHTSVVITGKERINDGQESRYLVFTENETFQNTDSTLNWKFNSSDIYGKLKEGQTCDMKVMGWRVPFLSWYRNIITANCIN